MNFCWSWSHQFLFNVCWFLSALATLEMATLEMANACVVDSGVVSETYPLSKDRLALQEEPEQEEQEDEETTPSATTVRGRFVIDESEAQKFTELDCSALQANLVELVATEPPPFPDDWASLTLEQRNQWLGDFWKTDEGKALSARNQDKLAAGKQYSLLVESDGNFVVYDVEQGHYRLQAEMTVEHEQKHYLLQAYGDFQIEDVEELDFSEIRMDVLRFLKQGEVAPNLKLQDLAGDSVELTKFQGKYVLLSFAALANPGFQFATDKMKLLQDSEEVGSQISFLIVSVDEEKSAATQFVQDQQIDWTVGWLGGWDQVVLNQYGLKAVPSFWLIDPQGNIALTSARMTFEVRTSQTTFDQVIIDAILGKLPSDQEVEAKLKAEAEARQKAEDEKAEKDENAEKEEN